MVSCPRSGGRVRQAVALFHKTVAIIITTVVTLTKRRPSCHITNTTVTYIARLSCFAFYQFLAVIVMLWSSRSCGMTWQSYPLEKGAPLFPPCSCGATHVNLAPLTEPAPPGR